MHDTTVRSVVAQQFVGTERRPIEPHGRIGIRYGQL
jgi:hypothetical protein